MKHCELGGHLVDKLWRAKGKTQKSGCKDCINKEKVMNSKIQYSPVTKESYDGDKTNNLHLDEIGHFETVKPNRPRYTKVEYTHKPKPVSPSNSQDDKSIPELLKLATIAFNRWIKRRDVNYGSGSCISCGKQKYHYEIQAGHYMPSTYSTLRFNEDNVHGECESCNCVDPNHLKFYRLNLIKKIGLEKVEALESVPIAKFHKWEKEELLEIIAKYK